MISGIYLVNKYVFGNNWLFCFLFKIHFFVTVLPLATGLYPLVKLLTFVVRNNNFNFWHFKDIGTIAFFGHWR